MIKLKISSSILAGIVVSAVIFVTTPFGQSAITKLKPVKPAVNQTAGLSDEQQGILAVRSTKAAVVSVVGSIAQNSNTANVLSDNIFGSGFIITPDGYIVSNSHVVQDTRASYSVVFIDGKRFPARVVGVDKYDDIALLKIDADKLGTVRLGNSDALETGQSVFAIGDALGKYQNTVTRGVVSGLGRDVSVSTNNNPQLRYTNLIQTDAAINQGNSGGPLINMAGEVIGMNTLIEAQGQGLGFAIPANTIKQAVEQLKANGKVARPYLGLSFLTVDKTVQAIQGLSVDYGALVLGVTPGSPSFVSGIRRGDVIVDINKDPLSPTNELDKLVGKYQAGNQLVLGVMRGKERLDLILILGEYK